MCKEDVGVYPKESDQPQDEEEVPEESPQEERRMQPKSPFCRSGKVAQIQKTCEKTNGMAVFENCNTENLVD